MGTRAFRYLLQPTARQRRVLGELLGVQRELYNAALEERRGVWRWQRRSVSRYEQYRQLTGFDHPVMRFGVCPARGTLLRVDRAFRAFFRRLKAGQTAGFPRFRGAARFDSVEYPDLSCWRLDEPARRLHLFGVGAIKARLHRPCRGAPKTITVRREGRRWWVTVFCTDVPAQPRPETGRAVGVDRGVKVLAATSAGVLIANPRHLARSADRLAGAQQALVAKRRGSTRRRGAVEAIARLHRKVANQRRDHLHKTSRWLIDHHDLIVLEDLNPSRLTRRPPARPDGSGGFEPNGANAKTGLNRSILDAGWGILASMLAYKAEDAGRQLIKVNPSYTSQRCASCGHTDRDNRSGTTFRCLGCGHQAHADINAAINILRAGLAQRAQTREAHNVD